jgi:hypothetical protein
VLSRFGCHQVVVAHDDLAAMAECLNVCVGPIRAFLALHLPLYVERVQRAGGGPPPDPSTVLSAIAKPFVAASMKARVSNDPNDWDWSIALPVILGIPYLRGPSAMQLKYLCDEKEGARSSFDLDTQVKRVVTFVRTWRNTSSHQGTVTSEYFHDALTQLQLLLLLCQAGESSLCVLQCRRLASPRPREEDVVLERLQAVNLADQFDVKCLVGHGSFGAVFLVRVVSVETLCSPSCMSQYGRRGAMMFLAASW